MTDAEKDELISDAGEMVHYLRQMMSAQSDVMQALFVLVKVAVKAEQWEQKRWSFGARDEQQGGN